MGTIAASIEQFVRSTRILDRRYRTNTIGGYNDKTARANRSELIEASGKMH